MRVHRQIDDANGRRPIVNRDLGGLTRDPPLIFEKNFRGTQAGQQPTRPGEPAPVRPVDSLERHLCGGRAARPESAEGLGTRHPGPMDGGMTPWEHRFTFRPFMFASRRTFLLPPSPYTAEGDTSFSNRPARHDGSPPLLKSVA